MFRVSIVAGESPVIGIAASRVAAATMLSTWLEKCPWGRQEMLWWRLIRGRVTLQKKDTSVTFWAERIFVCHAYDTSMMIIVTKHGIIIDVVGSYFYDKKS